MCMNAKNLPVNRGGISIHRRPMFASTTASERGYYTRYAGINAKPEVQR